MDFLILLEILNTLLLIKLSVVILDKIVITYHAHSVCERLSTLDVEATMGPDGFHPKLLSSSQAVAYSI